MSGPEPDRGAVPGALADEAELRQRYRDPHPVVLAKQIPRVDDAARTFIAATPLVVVASGGEGGLDASPRGGPPGFVRVLDDGHLAFADLAGNNRLDSLANIVTQPEVGLLFLVPGVEETLRVNGRAVLSDDPAVLEATAIDGRTPRLAVVVEVTQCYIHCGKAVRRAGLWEPERWGVAEDRPSAAAILVDHLELDIDPSVLAADLEAGYRATMWEPGGQG